MARVSAYCSQKYSIEFSGAWLRALQMYSTVLKSPAYPSGHFCSRWTNGERAWTSRTGWSTSTICSRVICSCSHSTIAAQSSCTDDRTS